MGVALTRLRDALADARGRGEPFDAVWRHEVSVNTASDTDLRTALHETADAWRRAFDGEPATPADTAATHLYGLWADADMEPAPGPFVTR